MLKQLPKLTVCRLYYRESKHSTHVFFRYRQYTYRRWQYNNSHVWDARTNLHIYLFVFWNTIVSAVCSICFANSKTMRLNSITTFFTCFSYTFHSLCLSHMQISCVTKPKSTAHCVSASIPRLTGVVWRLDRWLFSGKHSIGALL